HPEGDDKHKEKPVGKEGDDKAVVEKAGAEKGDKAAAEKAAVEKADVEKAAAEKATAEKAAAEKAAAEQAAAEEAERVAAEAAVKAKKGKPAGPGRGKLLVVAWGPSAAAKWEAQLTQAGFEVYVESAARLNAFQWAKDNQPVAAVIDLSHNPDDGKRLATTLRIPGATAGIPLVFCDA